MNISRQVSQSQEIAAKVPVLFQKRAKVAQERFAEQLQKAFDDNLSAVSTHPASAANIWSDWYNHAVDAGQRSILFWPPSAARTRGNDDGG